jgi:hypothetical protein
MADHGYQPLKPQVDEGELTLSILSTFDGDAEPEASYYGVCPHHAGVEGNVGFGSRSGCRTGFNVQTGLARFPPCTAARAHARLWYYRKVRFGWQAPTDRPKSA